jgi:pyruvate-formate lyase-activating enzyme
MLLGNFRKLTASDVPMIARVPIIPDFNADQTSVVQIFDFISECGQVEAVHLLPYHTLGKTSMCSWVKRSNAAIHRFAGTRRY